MDKSEKKELLTLNGELFLCRCGSTSFIKLDYSYRGRPIYQCIVCFSTYEGR